MSNLNVSQSYVLRRAIDGVMSGCYRDSVFTLSSECRNFNVILIRTVMYKIPPMSFTYPYNPHSVVSSNGSKLLMPGRGVGGLTRGVKCLVDRRGVHGRVKRQTHVRIRQFGVSRVTSR